MINKLINKIYSNKKILVPLLAFIIPIIIITLISIVSEFFPYGKYSILMADMRYQFVDYYGYMKSIFFGKNDFFYSFSKTFAGDAAGLLAYYCNNPFLVFLLFVPNKYLPGGILIMMSIMIGFIGLTFNIMINEMYGKRYTSLIYSTSYAFIGYLMGYFNCTLYYFDVMMLPLVILGLIRIVKTKKVSFLYVFSLGLCIFSSYYIGYMICIFTILIFIYEYQSECNKVTDFKNNYKSIAAYIVSSILAVSISAFSLLCAVFSLSGQERGGLSLSFSTNFNIVELFSGSFVGAFQGNVTDGLPLIYCGQIGMFFLLMFYLDKNVKLRDKIVSICIFIVLAISFLIDAFNVLWHGFSHPIGFPYRNSFLFSFFILYISYKSFTKIKEVFSIKKAIVALCIFAIYSIIMILCKNETVKIRQISITLIFVIAIICMIFVYIKSKKYFLITTAIFAISVLEISYNAYISINSYFPNKENDATITMEEYERYYDETDSLLNYIKYQDDSFYRIEKMFRRSNNDAMMFDYNGLSHFSSCEIDKTKRFMGNLGFRDNDNWAFYGESSTTFADCLMGVKYLISQYDENPGKYEKIYSENDKYIFINERALPLMFGTKDSIKNIDFEKEDHFSYQNKIASSFTDKEYNIYEPVDNINVNMNNVKKSGKEYSKIDESKEAYIEYDFIAKNDNFIFFYMNGSKKQDVIITVNDMEKPAYFTTYGWSIREVGYFNSGEKVRIKIYLNQNTIEIESSEFYYENNQEISNWYNERKNNDFELNEITSSHLIGKCKTDDSVDRLVFTIPCEDDWKIYIDGNEVKKEEVLNCLMSVKITPGEHHIEMKYVPKGIIIGVPVSIISIILTIIIMITSYKNKRKVVETENA